MPSHRLVVSYFSEAFFKEFSRPSSSKGEFHGRRYVVSWT